jgi:hypothetical protein
MAQHFPWRPTLARRPTFDLGGGLDAQRRRCDARRMEIRSLDDFNAAVNAECLIVITDLGTGNKVHRPDCSFVTAGNVTQKVIEGQAKNGRYYVVGSVARAESLHRAVPCGACAPS